MSLLAVDAGLRAGLAHFGPDGRLRWYRSQHFAHRDALRRAVHGLLGTLPDLTHVAVEGGGPIALPWAREAERRGLGFVVLDAARWRADLLHPRERRTGADAKEQAIALARRVVAWSGLPRPTALRHDAAEAVLTGLWAAHALGWLDALPDLRHLR